jgi:upstream activation factor subunit UAF30
MTDNKRTKTRRTTKPKDETTVIPDVSELVIETPSMASASAVSEPRRKRESKRSQDEIVEEQSSKPERSSTKSERKIKSERSSTKSERPSKSTDEHHKTERRSSENVEEAPKAPRRSRRPAPVEEKTSEESGEVNEIVEFEQPRTSKRRIGREELESQFDMLIERLIVELSDTKENKHRKVGVRVWNDVLKDVKRLKSSSLKAMKKPKKQGTSNNASGFMKPVKISEEMAEFTGWDPSELKSRVDVTKHLCQYIKEHDLQNPKDRRQIIADDKLQKLLGTDDKDESPLTYYYLQRKIQPHFKKDVQKEMH